MFWREASIIRDMEARYGAAFTRDVQDRITQCEAREVSYLELKQMNDTILPRYRERTRTALRRYRGWVFAHGGRDEDTIEALYNAYEGQFIRRQLEDAWHLYRAVNRDYHAMRHLYLEKLFRFQSPPTRAAA